MIRSFLSICLATFILFAAGFGTSLAQQSSNASQGASPTMASTISYQGVIAKDGVAVPDGDYTITTTLYRDGVGASSVWSGTYVVHTANGIFNLLLGSGDYPLPAASKLDATLFLGVKIGEGAELPLTQLSSAFSAMNVADSSITAKKMGTDYIGSISIDGQRFSTRGGDVNIITGDGMLATVDQATNSIILSATGGSSGLNGKGGEAEASSYINNSTSKQTSASFNIDGSGVIGGSSGTAQSGYSLTLNSSTTGAAYINGNVKITGTNTLSVGGSSSFSGNVQMNGGLTVSNAPFFTGASAYLGNTTYIHAGTGSGTLLVYGSPSSNGLYPIEQGQSNPYWNGGTGVLENTSIDGYAFGITDNLVGDVNGQYYSNFVTGIQGIPVTANAPSDGQVLAYNSSNGDLEWNTRSGGWSITGNAGTTPGSDFIGTTDAQNLQFGINNQQAGLIEGDIGTFGNGNTALGYQTLLNNAGEGNTTMGAEAMVNNTTGSGNTANGYNVLNSNTGGYFNVGSGAFALYSNTTGSGNTALGGELTLYHNTTGSNNSVVGTDALKGNTTGSNNTVVGNFGMQSNAIGSNNTTLGANADVSQDSLTDATAIGYGAIANNSYNIQLGDSNVTLVSTYGNIATSGTITSGHSLVIDGNAIPRTITGDTSMNIVTTAGNILLTPKQNVGIGKMAPAQTLDVNGAINADTGYTVGDSVAPDGQFLRSNGRFFVPDTLHASDIPPGSPYYLSKEDTTELVVVRSINTDTLVVIRLVADSTIAPSMNNVTSLGDTGHRFHDLYLGSHSLFIGDSASQTTMETNVMGLTIRSVSDTDTAAVTISSTGQLSVPTAVLPMQDTMANLGDTNQRFNTLYLGPNSLVMGNSGAQTSISTGDAGFSITAASDTDTATVSISPNGALSAGAVVATTAVLPSVDTMANLGDSAHRFNTLYLGPNSLVMGNSGAQTSISTGDAGFSITAASDTDTATVSISPNGALSAGSVVANTAVLPSVDTMANLGDSAHRFNTLYLGPNSLVMGNSGAQTSISTGDAGFSITAASDTDTATVSISPNGALSAGSVVANTAVLPSVDTMANLGDSAHRFNTLYLGPNSLVMGNSGAQTSISTGDAGFLITAASDMDTATVSISPNGALSAGAVVATTAVLPSVDTMANLGDSAHRFNTLYLGPNSLVMGNSGAQTSISTGDAGFSITAASDTDTATVSISPNGALSAGAVVATTAVLPSVDTMANLGDSAHRFNTLYLGPNSLVMGNSGAQTSISTGNAGFSITAASDTDTATVSISPNGALSAGSVVASTNVIAAGPITSGDSMAAAGTITSGNSIVINGDATPRSISGDTTMDITTSTGDIVLAPAGNLQITNLPSSSGTRVVVADASGNLSINSLSSFGSNNTASNGITRNDTDFELGGALTQATDIPLFGNNLTFSGTGNVGIGTTSPAAQLANSTSNTIYSDAEGIGSNGIEWDGNSLGHAVSFNNSLNAAGADGVGIWTRNTDPNTRILEVMSGSPGGVWTGIPRLLVYGDGRTEIDGSLLVNNNNINSSLGYQVNGSAPSGQYLRGNSVNFVASALEASDLTGTLGVANGGTGTATAFTTGSLPFAGAGGVYSQDNTDLFWDATNNALNIGPGGHGSYGALDVFQNGGDDVVFGGGNVTGSEMKLLSWGFSHISIHNVDGVLHFSNTSNESQTNVAGYDLMTIDGSATATFPGLVNIDNSLDMNSTQINNVEDPSLPQDAATKNYVDTHAGGSGNSIENQDTVQQSGANFNIDGSGFALGTLTGGNGVSTGYGYEIGGVGPAYLVLSAFGTNNIWVGNGAGVENNGTNNTGMGANALSDNGTGGNNTAVGYGALQTNQTSSNNTAIGYNADISADGLTNVTAIGANATVSASNSIQLGDANVTVVNSSGSYNTATNYQIGGSTVLSIIPGTNNVFLGEASGVSNTTGTNDAFLGLSTGASNTIGNLDLFGGSTAGYLNTSGSGNTFLGAGAGGGYNSGVPNTDESTNTLLGYNTDIGAPGVNDAMALGSGAIVSSSYTIQLGDGNITKVNTSGALSIGGALNMNSHKINNVTDPTLAQDAATKNYVDNASSGAVSGTVNTIGKFTGTHAIGNSDLTDNTTTLSYSGSHINSAGDYQIGGSTVLTTPGTGNLFLGAGIGASLATGTNNVATGYQALSAVTNGSSNTASGYQSLNATTTGNWNSGFGEWALHGNTIGSSNTATGYAALYSNIGGGGNTATGYQTLNSNTSGGTNTATGEEAMFLNSTGGHNSATGYQSLYSNTTGSRNAAIGDSALISNTTGSNNTSIGFKADVASGNLTNATAIGNGATVTASNTIQLGNGSVTSVASNGSFNSTGGGLQTNSVTRIDNSGNATLGTGSFSGAVNMNSHQINNVTDPTLAQDAATKHYVDNATVSNASSLETMTWEAPGTIGSTTPNTGAFTTLSATSAANSAAFAAENTNTHGDAVDATSVNGTAVNAQSSLGTAVAASSSGPYTLVGNNQGNGIAIHGVTSGSGIAVDAYNLGTGDAFSANAGSGNAIDATSTSGLALNATGNVRINGALDMNSNAIDNVTDPVSAQDAATKHYVDTHSGSAWGLTGNSGTNPATNFIGTSDAESLVFKVNNNQAGLLDASGNQNTSFGIGASDGGSGSNNTVIGYQALFSDGGNQGGGSENTAFGVQALYSNTNGYDNTATGIDALYSNTTGGYNTASGVQALYSNTTGINNTASGMYSLLSNTIGADNTSSGFQALYSNTTGTYNTASGVQALYSNTTSNYNTASGYQALYSNTTGDFNTASGGLALYSNATGNYNTASGYNALLSNTTGNDNTASGYNALQLNTTGTDNTASGYGTLGNNTTGNLNTAIGYEALLSNGSNQTGDYNTASGDYALHHNQTGSDNTASGDQALYNNRTGSNNTSSGSGSLYTNDNGSNNTAFGAGADVAIDGLTNATAIGANAIVGESDALVLGNGANVGIGTSTPGATLDVNGGVRIENLQTNSDDLLVTANNSGDLHTRSSAALVASRAWGLTGNSGTTYQTDFIGTTDAEDLQFQIGSTQAGLIEGAAGGDNNNTGLGWGVLSSNTTGFQNVAMGLQALQNNTTGSINTAIGVEALLSNSTGGSNTATGYSALQNNTTGSGNTANGVGALATNTTGSNNTALGYDADVASAALTNATAIGANAIVGESNALVLGGTGGNAVHVGIGTTTPQYPLDVAGVIQSGGDILLNENGRPSIYPVPNTNQDIQLRSSGTGLLELNEDQGGDIIMAVNQGIGSNVGIGPAFAPNNNTPPTERLDVDGNIHASGTITSGNSIVVDGTAPSGVHSIASDQSLNISANNSNTEGDITLSPASEQVGINTTTPSASLEVHAPDENALIIQYFNDKYSGSAVLQSFAWNYGEYEMGTVDNQSLTFFTQGYTNKRMTITGGGNIGIGTDAPSELLTLENGNLLLGNNNLTPAQLQFADASDTYFTTFAAGTQGADIHYILPLAQGASGTVLTNDGAGALSWAPVGAGSYILNQDASPQAGANFDIDGNGTIGGNLYMPNTTASTGVLYMNGARWWHNYGSNNAFLGLNAGNFTMIGTNDVAFGPNDLQNMTSGTQNTALGAYALVQPTTGSNNTGVGYNALNLVVDGSDNTAVGNQAGLAIASGVQNTFFGSTADASSDISNATAIGYGATVGGNAAIAMGTNVQAYNQYSIAIGDGVQTNGDGAVAIGTSISNAAGPYSVAIGNGVLTDAGANYSTAIGYQAETYGQYSVALGNGYTNTGATYSFATGQSFADAGNTDGYNTALGRSYASGDYTTALGRSTAEGNSNTNNLGYSTAMGNSAATGDYSTAAGISTASGDYSTAMGNGSIASGNSSTISGGEGNHASGHHAFIGGGLNNTSTFAATTVAGGEGNQAGGDHSFIGGGLNNHNGGFIAVIGGGEGNQADNSYDVVAGGYLNETANDYGTIGGGEHNDVTGLNATIAGGNSNNAIGQSSSIGGGFNNFVGGTTNTGSGDYGVIAGGEDNFIPDSLSAPDHATIGGGKGNEASNIYATVPGGFRNTAEGIASTAMGSGSLAHGATSFASGTSIANGQHSTAMGNSEADNAYNTALGQSHAEGPGSYSSAMGNSTAEGGSATAMGQSSALADYSTAMGNSTAEPGANYSTAMGGSFANNVYATAMGQSNASGQYATAMGYFSLASGDYSVAMGNGANTNSMSGSFVFSDGSASTESDAASEFMVRASGGYELFDDANGVPALTLTGGNLQIHNTGSAGQLQFQDASSQYVTTFAAGDQSVYDDNIHYVLPIAQGAASNVLTNDGSGNLSWEPAGAFALPYTPSQSYVTDLLQITNTDAGDATANAIEGDAAAGVGVVATSVDGDAIDATTTDDGGYGNAITATSNGYGNAIAANGNVNINGNTTISAEAIGPLLYVSNYGGGTAIEGDAASGGDGVYGYAAPYGGVNGVHGVGYGAGTVGVLAENNGSGDAIDANASGSGIGLYVNSNLGDAIDAVTDGTNTFALNAFGNVQINGITDETAFSAGPAVTVTNLSDGDAIDAAVNTGTGIGLNVSSIDGAAISAGATGNGIGIGVSSENGDAIDATASVGYALKATGNVILVPTGGTPSQLEFQDISGNVSIFMAGTQSAPITYILPTAQGGANTVLTNDGSGNLSWTNGGFALPYSSSQSYATDLLQISNTDGTDNTANAIEGDADLGVGVIAMSTDGNALDAITTDPNSTASALFAYNVGGNGLALQAEGNVLINGTTYQDGNLNSPIVTVANAGAGNGISGQSEGGGDGVNGFAVGGSGSGNGVHGIGGGDNTNGVLAENTDAGNAITANAVGGIGVFGASVDGTGVEGVSSSDGYSGVLAFNTGSGPGLIARSGSGDAIDAFSGGSGYALSALGNIVLGEEGGTPSQLQFNDVSGQYVTSFAAGDQSGYAANINYVLPIAQGGASTVLTNDGSGNLSWGAASGFTLPYSQTAASGTVLFQITNSDIGAAIAGYATSGPGVEGLTSGSGSGISGYASGSGSGVSAVNNGGSGPGLYAGANTSDAIDAVSYGSGYAFNATGNVLVTGTTYEAPPTGGDGLIISSTNALGIYATDNSTSGGWAAIDGYSAAQSGVVGVTATGIGVEGYSSGSGVALVADNEGGGDGIDATAVGGGYALNAQSNSTNTNATINVNNTGTWDAIDAFSTSGYYTIYAENDNAASPQGVISAYAANSGDAIDADVAAGSGAGILVSTQGTGDAIDASTSGVGTGITVTTSGGGDALDVTSTGGNDQTMSVINNGSSGGAIYVLNNISGFDAIDASTATGGGDDGGGNAITANGNVVIQSLDATPSSLSVDGEISSGDGSNPGILAVTDGNSHTASIVAGAATATLTLPATSGTLALSSGSATAQATPSDPTGTTSAGPVQMGIAGSITPSASGKILLIISGDLLNSNGDGAAVQISYGTGIAPSNGTTATGTTVGTDIENVGAEAPFTTNAVITGLTPGTAYWIDLQVKRMTGGVASVARVSISAIELP